MELRKKFYLSLKPIQSRKPSVLVLLQLPLAIQFIKSTAIIYNPKETSTGCILSHVFLHYNLSVASHSDLHFLMILPTRHLPSKYHVTVTVINETEVENELLNIFLVNFILLKDKLSVPD